MSTSIIRQDGTASLTFDAATEDYSPAIDVTEHPIEDGSSVTDHAQIRPLVFGITGTVTESPFSDTEEGGPARVERARDFLEAAQGQLLEVETDRWGTIRNVMLTGWPHQVTSRRSTTFGCTFKVVKIARAGRATIPPRIVSDSVAAGAPGEVDAGEQPTKAIPEERQQSTAARMADWVASLGGG